MVNNKRTPSGNFFQTTNPSLWQKGTGKPAGGDTGGGSHMTGARSLTAEAMAQLTSSRRQGGVS